ncbi:Nuclear cap-binding protein subunit 1 [Dimargaris cristalligena]|nr:Nuclear cap-binding protein subunit 1 [Dimargaris cristalligena]
MNPDFPSDPMDTHDAGHGATLEVDQFGRALRRSQPRSKPYDRPQRSRGQVGNGGRPGGFRQQRGGGRGGRGGGGFHSGGGPRTPHDHHRAEIEELEKRLTSLIIKVGDKLNSGMLVNLKALTDVVAKDFANHTTAALRAFQGAITELPFKTEVYATLVGLLNARQPDIGQAIVTMAWEQLLTSAKELRRWKVVKLWLRFFALLVPVRVVSRETVVQMLWTFLNAVMRDDASLQDLKRADTFVFLVQVTLPYLGQELDPTPSGDLDRILSTLQQYVERSDQRPHPEILNALPGLPANFPSLAEPLLPYYSYQRRPLAYLQQCLRQLASRSWDSPLIHRSFEHFQEELQAGQAHPLQVSSLELPAALNAYMLSTLSEDADAEVITATPVAAEDSLAAQINPLQAASQATYASKYRYGHAIPTAWLPLVADPAAELLPEHFLIYDGVLDVLDIFHVNRKDAASYLLQLRYAIPESLWQCPSPVETDPADPSAPTDSAASPPTPAHPVLNLDDIVLSALFARLFELPQPPHKNVYYAALTIELCKLSAERFLAATAAMVTQIFKTLPTHVPWTNRPELEALAQTAVDQDHPVALALIAENPTTTVTWDSECIHRLADWFGLYLSNSQYTWAWKDWEPVLSQCHPGAPAWVFAREVLYKCIRLSYMDRVKSTLPEEMQAILPLVSLEPNFRYPPVDPQQPDNSSVAVPSALRTFATQLMQLLRRKESISNIQAFLESAYENDLATISSEELRPLAQVSARVYIAQVSPGREDPATELLPENTLLTRVVRDVFVQTVLYLGSKSFSHMLIVIERYLPLLQKFSADNEARRHIVEIVNEFWCHNPQFITIIIDKLLNYRVIDPAAVVAWTLNPLRLQSELPAPFYVWEILRNTVHKIDSRIAQIEQRLTTQRSLLNSQGVGVGNAASNPTGSEPSLAENISHLETTLASLRLEQKELLLSLFQSFVGLLSTLLRECVANGVDPLSHQPYLWIEGRYREIIRTYHRGVKRLATTLETIVFTSDLNPEIINVFREALSL